jgi:transglutaminase-like putative cysteine protease
MNRIARQRVLQPGTFAWLAIPPLLLQCLALNWSAALTWPTFGLVICALLKLWRGSKPFDRRLAALLQLLAAGLLASQLQGLLATILQLIAVSAAFAGLLGHELGGMLSLRGLLRRSLQLLLAALPLALVLFLFVPRIAPLWTTELGPRRGAVTGLSSNLDPLSIERLATVNASAARVSLSGMETLPTNAYWRVLVHEQFDGRRWQHRDAAFARQPNRGLLNDSEISQWWIVEPSSTRAVPWDGLSKPTAKDQWVTSEGELMVGAASRQKRSFRLSKGSDPMGWQRRPPLKSERKQPPASLPRLNELGGRFRSLPTNQDRLMAVEGWFKSQPFRYSLTPGSMKDLDSFLFESQVGFCGHYASALAAVMRSADVPARVVSGYLGGRQIDPMTGSPYLELRQSDAHAWVEVWLEGSGWRQVDPSLWADRNALDNVNQGQQQTINPWSDPANWSLGEWLQGQWWGLDMAWTRWWLGLDQASQQAWFQAVLGPHQRWLGLLVVLACMASLSLGLVMTQLRLGSRQPLEQSLRLLADLGVTPMPGDTFSELCQRAATAHPDRSRLLSAMAHHHQVLTHALLSAAQQREHRHQWWRLQRELASTKRRGD